MVLGFKRNKTNITKRLRGLQKTLQPTETTSVCFVEVVKAQAPRSRCFVASSATVANKVKAQLAVPRSRAERYFRDVNLLSARALARK